MSLPLTKDEVAKDQKLTFFSPGSVKELGTIVWPLVLSFLSTCLMNFFNRLFLSHYSVEALEASVCAMNLALLFQIPCMRITTFAQVLVARFAGSQELSKIGSVVWQMIWLSFFSLFITLPLSFVVSSLFFQGSAVEKIGSPYFSCLMFANFLFPLGGAIGAFFAGQGRTKTLITVLAVAHVLQIALDRLLIFGIPSIFSPLGAFGAAISTVVSQSFYCFILFWLFLRKKEWTMYATNAWRFKANLFKECLYLGTPRSFAKMIILAAWSGSIAILTHKGGDYLLVFTLGTSLYTFFSCLNEGLGQGLITVASYYLGRKEPQYLSQIAKSSLMILAGILVFLSIFLLFFPQLLISTLLPLALTPHEVSLLVYSSYGLCFFFLCDGLSWIGFAFLNALKDMKFYFIYTLLTVLFFNYLPIYFAYQVSNWNAAKIWWIMSLPCLASAIAYYFRITTKLRTLTLQHPNESNV